jgi:DNA-binding transcriptional MocR family regulator
MVAIQPADLADRAGPVYRVLADVLGEAIGAGRIAAGERLPPQRELAWRLSVTPGTVGRAYELLCQRGLVRGEVGRGTYVLDTLQHRASFDDGQAAVAEVIDLSASFPAPIPAQARLADLLPGADTTLDGAVDLLRYPPAVGNLRHRVTAARWLKRLGLEAATPETTIITNGAEGALGIAMMALARPGDPILVEQLTYARLRTLGARLGLPVEPVVMDEAGVLPEALATAIRQTGARLLIVSPTISNPTAALMPAERRAAVAEVAHEHGLTIIEDEVYGPLVPDRPAPLASHLPERTIYITSVSKFLAPGLRLGIACAATALMREIAAVQSDLSLGHTPLAAEIFARCESSGLLEEALAQQQAEMSERQVLAAETLGWLERSHQPTALHVWVRLPSPWTSAEAALALARGGILVSPAERFFVGRGAAPAALRLSLSAPSTRAHLCQALARIDAILRMPSGVERSNI